MPRGQGWPSPGRRQLTIRFGEPLRPREGESVREFAPRIKAAVATLLDEDRTTWWEARRRAAAGDDPGPVRAAGRPVAAGVGAVGVALGRRAGPPAAGLGPRGSVRGLSPLAHARLTLVAHALPMTRIPAALAALTTSALLVVGAPALTPICLGFPRR